MNSTHLPARFLFERQFQHLLLLGGLIPGTIWFGRAIPGEASFMGITGQCWFFSLVAVVVFHQVIVWFVFRTQLVFSLLSNLFGKYDMAVWTAIFMPLLILRPALTIAVAMADSGSMELYRPLEIGLGLALLAPAIYTFWSVGKYFGIRRALGGDHFRSGYREMPLVRQGAFRYSQNAMYIFGFCAFWAIALLAGSVAALGAAIFQHAYIWVHMYCTEEPDMKVLYSRKA